ncbi:MAG TPA: NAD(+)/NADH kinase [Candidatus Eisenbacteria bacterium]|nr:NAD(+)/NADH kinase [Candidatus Eisenbacteria bacterium]
MKSVAIISKPWKQELASILPELLSWFHQRSYQIYMDQETAQYTNGEHVLPREAIGAKHPDFVLVLGGDGTLLSAARAVAHEGIPILAVNLGSLGFLTEIPLNELYVALEAVDQGQCPVEFRSVLDCQLVRGPECISQHFALNDVVVNKSAISRLVEFDLYIDGNFVFQYKADGVIIATPTGSTAYSLAAGGPVMMPSVEAFVVTPVCPHSLTHRPLVVTDKSQIELRVETGEEQAFLSIDGQVGVPVQQGDRVLCQRAPHKVKLMRVRRTFFEVLRNKLKWGQR